jgi:hypothetical protein
MPWLDWSARDAPASSTALMAPEGEPLAGAPAK